ncbi:RepA leader peptide Tap [Salmonella enterica]|uniref:RepA leader peptide Tap n=1 Tax=Salmonella oranienberg TaxID=28147 RepID=A0A5W8FWI7_SALON|nr:RepA leader peptide Tap [Salmonella enterica]EBR9087143.1 RepA leader peptide Tap [Salmonella enterica subsp. enterica serovar Oranienburg]EBS1478574.1 RepA leader peptide Tap [Salmonella enterica subsp. enterica serovar Saintpaul]ECI4210173.1 RepA leader peptide Tap [Salmonella enterica subsp. enterica]EDP1393744.1 RepA leader peptide Tap [Salmonella enterica subsp. enterica serovar Reading]EHE7049938.1 RepA leader peptide Tap [Salmonella enterica subsp. enterica serovar Adelaide]EIO46190
MQREFQDFLSLLLPCIVSAGRSD